MFPEYRELISTLKVRDTRFARLFQEHNDLDQRIQNVEAGIASADGVALEGMKKHKLQLKDQLYAILRQAAGASSAPGA